MREAEPLSCLAASEEEGAHRGGLADADGGNGGADVGHGVVDCEARGDGAAGGVDVEGYRFGGGVGFEEEELGDDGGGHDFVYGAVEADNAFLGMG